MATDYKTLRVPADDYEQAKQSKRDSETWGEFLQRCTDTPPEIREFVEAGSGGGGDGVTYDDVVAATRQAIRDELPDHAFR